MASWKKMRLGIGPAILLIGLLLLGQMNHWWSTSKSSGGLTLDQELILWTFLGSAIVASIWGYVAHMDTHSGVEKPRPDVDNSLNATASGAGTSTNNQASGTGSQIGQGNKSNSDNQNINIGGLNLSDWPQGLPVNITINNNSYYASPDVGLKDLKENHLQEAVTNTNQAISIEPRNPAIHNNRAIARFATEDYTGAIADWKIATELEPSNYSYHANLAKALSRYAVGRPDVKDLVAQSIQETQLSINTAPNYGNLKSGLYADIAAGYFQLGQGDEAEQFIQAALNLDPNGSHAHSLNGLLLLRNGENEKAVAETKKAIELDPGKADPYFTLAKYYAFIEPDREKAYVNLKMALKLDPSYSVNFNNPNTPWTSLYDDLRFKAIIEPYIKVS